jgi:hypothetical protein
MGNAPTAYDYRNMPGAQSPTPQNATSQPALNQGLRTASPQEAQLIRMRAQGFGPEVLAMQQEWQQSNYGQNGRPTPTMDRNLQEYGGVQGANRYFSNSPAYRRR